MGKKWLNRYTDQKGQFWVEILSADNPTGKWSTEDLELDTPVAFKDAPSGALHLSGPGSVLMYLLLGISAGQAEIGDVFIVKPAIPYDIHFSADGRCEAVTSNKNSRQGVVIGVLGDPNSGKSVFSRNFAMTIRNSMPLWFSSWIYDCDLASPTPEWYLADSVAMAQKREIIKSHIWTAEMEQKVADDLSVLRHNLDLTLADMPGGKPSEDGPLGRNRIPSENRAAMMASCDAFIVLCRQDDAEEIFSAWKTALAQYHLEDRIIAKLISASPEKAFSISPLEITEDGLFTATITGLDRKKDFKDVVRKMTDRLGQLVQYISFIRVARVAQAACAQAFLTGIDGTRYGAAVRSTLTGRIFSAGQYSSFNHSTNMHAEMNALSQAAISGEPDVDVLAIACSKPEKAIPCGVCRQVMLEHAQRTGRDFAVVLVNSDIHFQIKRVSELLPDSWSARPATASGDERQVSICQDIFQDIACETGSCCLETIDNEQCLTLIWDPLLTPTMSLQKIKYVCHDGRWHKLPHAFTQGAEYQKYLIDHRCNTSSIFPMFAVSHRGTLKQVVNPRSMNSQDMPEEELHVLKQTIFEPAGIDFDRDVLLYGSRLLGMQQPSSDFDLIVRADRDQVNRLRAHIAACFQNGILQLPESSGSIKYLGKICADIRTLIEEHRYCETMLWNNIAISMMLIPAHMDRPAFSRASTCLGRRNLFGKIVEDSLAPFKRSETVLQTVDGQQIRILCYYKVGNLLRNGDMVSVSGNYYGIDDSRTGTSGTLLLGNSFTDKIVWMK